VNALGRGDWPVAIAAFRKGMEMAPDEPTMRHRLATALAVSGDVDGAIAQFREVVRRSPAFARSRLSLGVLLESTGERQEALAQLSAAADLDPDFAEAHLRLAEVLREAGRAREARSRFERVLTIDPHSTEGRLGLAILLTHQGEAAAARERLEQGLRLKPGEVRFAHALARLLAASPDGSVRDGNRALALAEALSAEGLLGIDRAETRAMALAELGRFDEARAEQQTALAAAQRAGAVPLTDRLTAGLRSYEDRRPLRDPWGSSRSLRLASD
jgi:tetratricopeptide (TPR) repeat protein